MTSWTPERVERLKQMWADGYSASEIARTLGGITRNAVIGKRNRLGLEARSEAGGRPCSKQEWAGELKRLVDEGRSRAEMMAHFNLSDGGLRRRLEAIGVTPRTYRRNPDRNHVARRIEARTKLRRPKEPPPLPESKMLSLMDLEPTSCRWPIGDPKEAGFGFCGVKRKPGSSYCEHHDHIACVEPEKRRRGDRPNWNVRRKAA